MTTVIKTPPTARFENRFPPDEELTETERAARRERTHRAAAAYDCVQGDRRGAHHPPHDPRRIAAAVERQRSTASKHCGRSPGEEEVRTYIDQSTDRA